MSWANSSLDDGWRELVAQAGTNQTAALAIASTPEAAPLEWWDEAGPRAEECMSVTKFVVAMALGLASGPATRVVT